MDYFNFKTRIRPGKGRLLVSEPMLPDPNFERSVILLFAHDDEGSFGFVMNKPSETPVSAVFDEMAGNDMLAYAGGPVAPDTLHFIHAYPHVEGAREILPGIFWGGDPDVIRAMAASSSFDGEKFRFLLGYSGWAAGQLEEELKENAWIVSGQADQHLLFATDAGDMWAEALHRLGGRFSRVANYPTDPRLN